MSGVASRGGARSVTGKRRNGPRLEALEAALGHAFQARALLEEALTHVSAAGPSDPDNQRLEFLGDRILGLAIAEMLYERHPSETEGALAPRLNALVRKETCAEIASTLGLGDHLRMAKAEIQSGGRRKTALLADAMEAVIAAVYLDGGPAAARDMVLRLWAEKIETQQAAPIDAKTALQEWAQAQGTDLPHYALLSRDGPDHAPRFTVEARAPNGETAIGAGPSKRAAEQAAAADLLAKVSGAR